MGELTGAMAASALDDPLRFAARTAREFGHFWELYPTRLTVDCADGRRALHQRDPRLPTDESFPRTWRKRVSALSFGTELCFAFGGLVVGLRTRRREILLLLTVILSYALGYSLFMEKMRYRIPVLPPVFILAGVGAGPVFACISDCWRSWRRRLAARSTAPKA